MTLSVCSLVAAAIPDAAQLPNALNPNTQQSLRGVLPIIIVVAAVVVALVIWAVFIRKSPRYRQKGALLEGEAEESGGRRRRRRRRRDHRTRNPTRAQTGGLPPQGAGGSEPPPL
jgi:hypothetical protein